MRYSMLAALMAVSICAAAKGDGDEGYPRSRYSNYSRSASASRPVGTRTALQPTPQRMSVLRDRVEIDADDQDPEIYDQDVIAPANHIVGRQQPRYVDDLNYDNSGASCNPCNNCGDPCGNACCRQRCCRRDEEPWVYQHRVWGEYLQLHPGGIDMAYAFQQNGTGGAGTVPNGAVGTLAPEYRPTFRVGFDIALSQCSGVFATFMKLDTNTDSQLAANSGVGSTVESLVLHPGTVHAGSTSDLIAATYGINFSVVDVGYRALLESSPCYGLNWFVGGRWGQLEQKFSETGTFAPPTGDLLNTTNITVDGGGLLIGLDGERRLGKCGFSVYGKGQISTLFGKFKTSYEQLNTTTTVVEAFSTWDDHRVMPILEFEAGLAWTSCNDHWRFSAGYYNAFWFNAITTGEYVRAVQKADFVGLGDTISFDGLTARAEVRW